MHIRITKKQQQALNAAITIAKYDNPMSKHFPSWTTIQKILKENETQNSKKNNKRQNKI